MDKVNNDDTKQNLELLINHHTFVISFIELINLVNNKSIELIQQSVDNAKSHERLQSTCCNLLANFQKNEDNDFDEGKIIKKIYKTISKNLDKLVNTENDKSSIELFFIRNEEHKLVTIIPGVELSLVVKEFNEEELNILWGHLYILFISAAKMLSLKNDHKKTSKVWEIIPILQERVAKMGLTIGKDKKTFNPYIGFNDGNSNVDIDNLFNGVEIAQDPSTLSIMENLGIEKLLDINKLSDQLKNCSEEDIESATQQIASMLGSDDSDVKDVCGTLVSGIVKDIKENGLKSMSKTAESVAQKVKHTMDKKKMEKTANQLSNFIDKGQEELKNMKDEKGNPIGANILKNLGASMNFIKNFTKKNAN